MAIKLGANGYVGGAIGAALLEPNYTNLVTSGAQDVSFLGIPVILASYSSTVFPILIAVAIYSVLDKFLKKVIYKDLQMFINPLISLLDHCSFNHSYLWSFRYLRWGSLIDWSSNF